MFSKTLVRSCCCALLATIAGLTNVSAQNREVLGEYRIGVIGRDQNNVAYQAVHLGARNAAAELSAKHSIDVEILVYTPLLEQGGSQTAALAELFIENADGLILSPSDTEAIASAVNFAVRQDQALVFFEDRIEGIEPLASILADEYEAGRLAGEAILEKLPRQGRVAILSTENPTPAIEERLRGARAALGYRRIQTVATCRPDYLSAIETIRATEEADRNDQIRGWLFLGEWPLSGMPALPWRPGKLPAVAIQSSPSAFLYLDQGYIDTLITHPYYDWGYRSVEVMVQQLHLGQSPENREVRTAPKVIDFRNIDAYREKWKQWLNQ